MKILSPRGPFLQNNDRVIVSLESLRTPIVPTHRFLIAILLCVLLSARTAPAQDLPYVQHQNIVYGEAHGVGLLMDIFTPKGATNGLGVVDVISGAWHSDRGKIRDHERARTFHTLCNKGYTVFAVRPGSITKFNVLEMLANLNAGVRWVKTHAGDYGIDPDRLGLMGASAGGHLACLAAVAVEDGDADSNDKPAAKGSHVKAVAVFFPPTDFLDFGGKALGPQDDLTSRLLGNNPPSDLAPLLKQISPAHLVTANAPPFLLIHGDADPIVPLQQSERMLAALKQAGVSAELIVKRGGGHPWFTIHEEVQVVADWFDRQLSAK
jgi:acetyl esterase/lipase